MTNLRREKDGVKYPYVTVTSGISGFFAVMIWLNPDGDFEEPWETGIGRYKTSEKAKTEGKFWAESEEVDFRP